MFWNVRGRRLCNDLAILFVTISCYSNFVLNVEVHGQTDNREAGYCRGYDFDDEGYRFCKKYETFEELKSRHVRLRKACKVADRCEVTQFLKLFDRYYYHSIKICSNSTAGGSTFILATDSPQGSLLQVNRIEKKSSSCVENVDEFQSFYQDVPTYFVVTSGKVGYGGVMAK